MSEREGLVRGEDGRLRCWWGAGPAGYRDYHDLEWGRPVVDDRLLFEMISLEGFQAGLSWWTILRKREAFRRAFDAFDPSRVARFGTRQVDRLLADAGIVRHRGKIEAVVANAGRALDLARESGSLAAYFWRFEPAPSARPRTLTREALLDMVETEASRSLSRDLRRRGWKYVGPTTTQSFLQAVGLVNDHLEGCHVRGAAERARQRLRRPRGHVPPSRFPSAAT